MPKSIRYQLAVMGLIYVLFMCWLHIGAMDFYLNQSDKALFGDDMHAFWRWMCEDVLNVLHERYAGQSGQDVWHGFVLHYLPIEAVMFGAFLGIGFDRVWLTRGLLCLSFIIGMFSMSHPYLFLILMACASFGSDGWWWSRHH